ncbi:MAG: tRNA (adenosine(37)-N6)-threonylcarbamoyltransferase complex dimerization subunit type 1 TsaB [Lachnospiraceae bacterium]
MNNCMKILAIDSSGLVATLAIMEEDNLIAEYTIHHKKTHSQTLLPMLEEIRGMVELNLEEVDVIAIASGPGSFTGLRIGSATAKGLGMALGKPLVEIPTLEGMAYQMYGVTGTICPIMDARRNQVYTGFYGFGQEETSHTYAMEKLAEAGAMDIMECIDICNNINQPVMFLGDGVKVYKKQIINNIKVPVYFAPAHRNLQSASSIAARAFSYVESGRLIEAKDHAPKYFRLSQAERERKEKELQG